MEKRYGSILILVWDAQKVSILNSLLSKYASIILGRQGIPLREQGFSLISIIVEALPSQISALSGQIGKIKGLEIKSCVLKQSALPHNQHYAIDKHLASELCEELLSEFGIKAYLCKISGKRWAYWGGEKALSFDTIQLKINNELGLIVENSENLNTKYILQYITKFLTRNTSRL